MKIVHRSELKLVKKITEMPSVEIDLASIPDGVKGLKKALKQALPAVAAQKKSCRATLYYLKTSSVNFHRPTDSVFVGVAGNKKLLDIIYNLFSLPGADNVRDSDEISPKQAKRFLHLQDGNAWAPDGTGHWRSLEYVKPTASDKAGVTAIHDDAPLDDTPVDDTLVADTRVDETPAALVTAAAETSTELTEPVPELSGQARNSPSKFPSFDDYAHGQHSIKATRTRIAKLTGLPEEAILLCGPDLIPLHSNVRISTLKKRWQEAKTKV